MKLAAPVLYMNGEDLPKKKSLPTWLPGSFLTLRSGVISMASVHGTLGIAGARTELKLLWAMPPCKNLIPRFL